MGKGIRKWNKKPIKGQKFNLITGSAQRRTGYWMLVYSNISSAHNKRISYNAAGRFDGVHEEDGWVCHQQLTVSVIAQGALLLGIAVVGVKM